MFRNLLFIIVIFMANMLNGMLFATVRCDNYLLKKLSPPMFIKITKLLLIISGWVFIIN